MLKSKLFKAFALVVLIFAGLSAFIGTRLINKRIVDEAQTRVRLDLSSAWAIYKAKLREIEVILRLASVKEAVVAMCDEEDWKNEDVANRLERIRASFGLDFLDILAPNGRVVLRTTDPHHTGDYRSADPAITAALRGESVSGISVLTESEMKFEADGLAERAFIELKETPKARATPKTIENRGMFMMGAAPIRQGSKIVGVVHGGVLINRNNEIVDKVCEVVFKHEKYNGVPVGTATIFLNDCRIATTVRLENGNRAIGTRVSREVAERVLDNGQSWEAEADVVKERCLTAYEPIRDVSGQVAGMLYVGILKRPFDDIATGIMMRYVYVSLFVLLVALVLAYILANAISRPIHKLVEASNAMKQGRKAQPIDVQHACQETTVLIDSFNEMATTLAEREENLRALNRSYMETLGFVSHELKSPVATIMNYVYLLKERKLGPMTEKQEKASLAIDRAGARLVEMVRHYLNLSRIESGELSPVLTKVQVHEDVLHPLIEGFESELESRKMKIKNFVRQERLAECRHKHGSGGVRESAEQRDQVRAGCLGSADRAQARRRDARVLGQELRAWNTAGEAWPDIPQVQQTERR